MSAVWVSIGALCVITIVLKAAGPATLGSRTPPDAALAVIALVAPAILTGLVVYETFVGNPDGITVDARVVGLVVALGAALARWPAVAVVALAATATALTRLVF